MTGGAGGGDGTGRTDDPGRTDDTARADRIGAVLSVLADSGVELSQEELLDALWLARRMPPGAEGSPPLLALLRDRTATPPPRPVSQSGAVPPPGLGMVGSVGMPTPAGTLHSGPGPGPTRRPGAHRPDGPRPPGGPRGALPVRVPEGKALAEELLVGRALRPLKRHRDGASWRWIDVEATVDALAETGLPDVALRPARVRWLDLALVVDDSLSMLLWQRLLTDVRATLERLGAFRTVRTYGLHAQDGGELALRGRPFDPSAPTTPPHSLADPSGHTLVLLLSDGVGRGWRDGRKHQALARWARCGPTAVVHALPRRMWDGSGLRADLWSVTTGRRGAPGAAWTVGDPVLPAGLAPFDGIPVPVLEPRPEPLAAWARLLASPGGSALLPLLRRPEPPGAAEPPGDGVQRLQRFRDAASPDAYRLAAHLAGVAPLSVPVMRLVQAALDGQADTAHLAEVFLSGLMRPADPEAGPVAPRHRVFDFTDEARDALLDAVPTAELLATGRRIGERLRQLAGTSPDFPAWLAHPAGMDTLPAGARPFAEVGPRLAARFGAPARTVPGPLAQPRTATAPRMVAARYRLLDTIGSSGADSVWRAHDESLGRQVAVKYLRPPASHPRVPEGDQYQYFRGRARIAVSLQHPGVAVIHDFGVDHGSAYLVMELLDGRSLSHVLRDRGGEPLPVADLLSIAEQLAAALGYAHKQGIAHEALRPSKITLMSDGTVKVRGFGAPWFTNRPSVIGANVDYLPPEALHEAAPAPRGDLYALGCVLYELATGTPPFTHDDERATILAHRDTPPRPPRELRPDLPEPVQRIILHLLAKAPEDRPPTADAVRERIAVARGRATRETGPASLTTIPCPNPTCRSRMALSSRFCPTCGHDRYAPAAPAPAARAFPRGWLPLADGDPTRVGPYSMYGRLDSGPTHFMGLGIDERGEHATVRTPRPDAPPRALPALQDEAEILRRLAGRYAPRLLGHGLDEEPPWTATDPVLTADGSLAPSLRALLDNGTVARWDDRVRATVGRHLAEALDLCSALGIVHRQLSPEVVLVKDRSVRIIRWTKGTIDGRDRFRTDNVFALGPTLLALAGDGHTEARLRSTADQRWPTSDWDPLRRLVRRCLSPSPRERPTARELADAFAEHTGPTAGA